MLRPFQAECKKVIAKDLRSFSIQFSNRWHSQELLAHANKLGSLPGEEKDRAMGEIHSFICACWFGRVSGLLTLLGTKIERQLVITGLRVLQQR